MIIALVILVGYPDNSSNNRKRWRKSVEELLRIQEENSSLKKCTKYIKHEEQNCIVSAIINLLKYMHRVKIQINKTLNKDEQISTIPTIDDVKLTGSIITGEIEKVNNEKVEDIMDDNEENPYFSFNETKKEEDGSSRIIEDLRRIDGRINFDKMVKSIYKISGDVRNYKMNRKTKLNRINFFATLL